MTANDPAPDPIDADIVVIVAHPRLEQSRVNRRLLDAARRAGPPARIAVRDLYWRYPDFLIDVAAEQALLARARLVVWQHPIHWYHMPPLMKLWVDEVLAFGWAYGPGGGALRGKDLWLVATTGGPEESYRPDGHNRHAFDAFLPAYEQTAALCGMRFLPPLVRHGAHRLTDAELTHHAQTYAGRLASHPDWPELDTLLYGLPARVPDDVRPDIRSDGVPGARPDVLPDVLPDVRHDVRPATRPAPTRAGVV